MPRESESKRHHSRFDRESSPKRSRRDGKPTMERTPNRLNPEVRDKYEDRKHRCSLQDPLPLEKPYTSAFKHNDCSNTGTTTGRGGRSADRGRGRNHEDDRRGRHRSSYTVDTDEKPVGLRDDSWAQRREEPSNTKGEQPTKKKFREEKLLPIEEIKMEDNRAEQGNRGHGYAGKNEYYDRGNAGHRVNRARLERGSRFPSRGREGYIIRQGYVGVGGRVDKWKHDMFDEVNRSPASKYEEDTVAKVEALLSL